MANSIGSLLVEIGADISGLEVGGKNATKTLKNVGERARELGNELAKLGAAAAAAGAAMAAALVKSGLSAIDSQAKLARSLDSTIDGLRALQLAAQDAGLSTDAMSANLQRMNRRLGEMATTGAGPAAGWLNRLGLSAQELLKLPLEDRTARIADEIGKLSTSAEMASAAFAIFGDGGLKMVPMLQQGGEAIRAARADVDAFGLSLSEIDAAKVEMANDAMTRIGLTFEAVRNKITVAVAPILKALADRFNDVAKANKGFGDQAVQVFDTLMRWVGKFADVLHSLRVVFKGVELIATGAWAAIVSGAQLVAETVAAMVDGINAPINAVIRKMNELGANIAELPSISDSDFMVGMREFADEARNRVGDVRTELQNLAMQEMPSDKIAAFLEDVKNKAQEAAESVASVTTGGVGADLVGGVGSEGEEDPQAVELEKYRETLAAKLEALQEFQMTEAELELKRHEERLLALSEALALEMVTAEEARALQQSLEEEHMKRMGDIRKKGMTALEKFTSASFANQVKTVAGYMTEMTAGLAQHSKTMFELNKAAGIANAVVATYQGMAEALKLGWPLGPIAAAAIGAQGFAQVAAIKSQSFSGAGGAAPSLAGSTPATPVTPVNGGTGPAGVGGGGGILTVEGIDADQLFSGRVIRGLVERINEHVRDGGTVQFA